MMHYWEWIRNNIDPSESIIDLGYGDGNTWKMGVNGKHDAVPENLPKYNVTGVEYNEIKSEHNIINDDLCNFIQYHKKHYDVAVASNVLEHVKCPTELILWAVYHAKRLIIVVPIGEDRYLMEHGEEAALNNPWVSYKKFHYDSECQHNAHIRVFYDATDVYSLLPQKTEIVKEINEVDASGTKWYGVIVIITGGIDSVIKALKLEQKDVEKTMDIMYMHRAGVV